MEFFIERGDPCKMKHSSKGHKFFARMAIAFGKNRKERKKILKHD